MKARELFISIAIVTIACIIGISFFWKPVLWSFILFGPLIWIGTADIIQKIQTIKNNFPVIGRLRYLFEKIRPEIQQYFVETDTEGAQVNREYRSVIYKRAKNTLDTTPFGTKMDVYSLGYEWMNHSKW